MKYLTDYFLSWGMAITQARLVAEMSGTKQQVRQRSHPELVGLGPVWFVTPVAKITDDDLDRDEREVRS